MGAVRLGPVRVSGPDIVNRGACGSGTGSLPAETGEVFPGRRGSLRGGRVVAIRRFLTAVSAWSVGGCVDAGPEPSGAESAYAEIVAEEDARGEAGLDRVQAHLGSVDPEIRRAAVRALGRLEDPDWSGRLLSMLDDPDPEVRIAVAAALAQSAFGRDPGEVLPALATRVDSESDPAVLGSLATNLGRLAFADAGQREMAGAAFAALARRVENPGEDPRLAARLGLARGLEAFARGGGTQGSLAPELLAALRVLSEAAPGTAGELVAARIRRLAVAALRHTDRLAPDHATNLLADEDWGVRRQVMIWAAAYGTGAGALIRVGLRNPDPRVRVEALRAYDRLLRPDEGCAAILDAVTDPDPHVAATALGLLADPCPGTEGQRPTLAGRVAALDEAGGGWRGPARALHALAGIAPREAGDRIRRFARHDNPFVRAWAARAAARAAAVEVLNDLSGDENPNVRDAALRGLGAVAGSGSRDRYLAALDSDDPQLVMTAAGLLVDHAATGTPVSALLESLARFTAARRETERDARVALLEAVGAVGGFSSEDLSPYLSDFDPVVADLAAALLTESTGTVHEAAPRRLPRAPTPGAYRLRELAVTEVRLRMAGLGDIVIALRPDLAATNADRFARLAGEGYFNGLTFHRVVPNFVVQGGSPGANEYAGDGPFTRDEISDHPHWRGTVGLSTRGRDTGDAQLFINLVDNVRLDFDYTIFGEVVDGMEIVDAVREGTVIERAEVVTR